MDVQMPELDGLDATRRICERWPPESRPHIVAMTANALPEDREACFAAGMNDYVAKPIRGGRAGGGTEARAARVRTVHAWSGGTGEISLEAAALQNLRDLGGAEFLAEVVDVFLADAPALIASLRSSLERQDTEELRRAAHTLKSNGSTLGATAFAELCRTVEQRAKDGRLDGVSQARGSDRAGVPDARRKPSPRFGRNRFRERLRSRTGTILIADDNRVNRLLLGRGLEHERPYRRLRRARRRKRSTCCEAGGST